MIDHDSFSPYYPVFLDLKRKECLVVGGGTVAFRKVQALAECGAWVTVVSPGLCPELAALAGSGQIRVVSRDYQPGDLSGALLAVAATDDRQTNEKVAAEAGRRGVLVNVVDVPRLSTFIVPSYFRRGDVTVAVSTSGRSPALARKLRTEMEKDIGATHADLALLVSEVRSELKQLGLAVENEAWQEALEIEPLVSLLKDGRRQEAKSRLLDALKAPRQDKP